MKYLSAIEAARRIGVNEKTVRLWVQSGKLSAIKPARNRLAIPETEVEQKAREHQMFNAEQGPAETTADLLARVQTLEATVATLLARIGTLESHGSQKPVEASKNVQTSDTITPRQKRIIDPLPPGCISIRDFAALYGVNPNTFRDHVTKGIGRGEKERVAASERPKPGRPGETERYLTPEQQQDALAFWDRHGIVYIPPADDVAGNDG